MSISRIAIMMAALADSVGMYDVPNTVDTNKLRETDISKEYELIMQKKSKLSASERHRIVRMHLNSGGKI